MSSNSFDVIVVGAGHAGSEAAAVSAKLGSKTLLITSEIDNIAKMSCNPAIGGIAKGQIIKEINALGGLSGLITDRSMIQFRMLNQSKGPAMWSPRAQCDRRKFLKNWKSALKKIRNLSIIQDTIIDLIIRNKKIIGVKSLVGKKIFGKAVILAAGTFLNGRIHIGNKKTDGGRLSETAVLGLTKKLTNLGFVSGRLKTGTSPRVDARSLNYNKMIIQNGDLPIEAFSFLKKTKKQKKCYITYTDEKLHELIRNNIHLSPLYNGNVKSKGPRYCPSIEDKIYRFPNKTRHQIFVEPDGNHSIEMYINGFSTSLPIEIQKKALLKIPGFEKAIILKPGYAIEYDYFNPNQLKQNLETQIVENLFFAGQINGTTGYEEAAAQGLIAGINAHLKITQKKPLILKRNEAYIGVLIDDLINKGTQEPYRMFTSLAEYRIFLRQDNADQRLMPIAYKLGLIYNNIIYKLRNQNKQINLCIKFFNNRINSRKIKTNYFKNKAIKIIKFLSSTKFTIKDIRKISLIKNFIKENKISNKILKKLSILLKYKVYLKKEEENVKRILKLENLIIPKNFNYDKIKSLSLEAREKLFNFKPKNLGEALKISGISHSDLNNLLFYIRS
ncbi:tRNA uridine-5-carboxymethylaminomethyl(34) synthesis enzyme MnmG [Candidatus Karelsulcia muelleri]|uniref:tRNA uridine-5-carboxymethylaminomethyl(34) synthesis enzyme MnmG n=1 Tax=Candidatus Karelsulcia muelleri TaxID=336810 RepID=UPI00194EDCC9|nr:tRNA uridine-5-carboxymethylaminomethyl(34) synthesis enzyme MnmG [Candidatus Karelsulcia muelleri]